MKSLFFGGIHPKYKKEMSTGITEIKNIIPKQVVIPMIQHIGDPCTDPLVQVGDRVRVGEKIGDGEGLCVPVHASVSGTVVAIEPRLHTNGKMIMAVVIDNDFADEAVEAVTCDDPLKTLSDDEILGKIREAGLVGMGGAAFPCNVKAVAAMGKIDYLIAFEISPNRREVKEYQYFFLAVILKLFCFFQRHAKSYYLAVYYFGVINILRGSLHRSVSKPAS